MHRKMIGFWCLLLLLLDLKTAFTQTMPGPNMYHEHGPPPKMEQSSIMGNFPSMFDFLREPFGNGSLFSSGLPGFLQRSPPPSHPHPPRHPHYHHHHPDHPPPPHHLKMMHKHRPHGPLHPQASFIHPIISELTTKKAPFEDEPEPYTFEPIILFQRPEQEQGNLTSAELMNFEATLREKIAEQTQGLSTMASQISNFTIPSKPNEKDQIQEEARASFVTTIPTVKTTTAKTTTTTETTQATAETSSSNNSTVTDQSLTQAESYQQPRHHSQTPGKPYSFSYVVKNKYGNNFNQEEHSDGSTVRGQYRTLLPDGRIQTVMYIADKIHGYNAVVTYEGTAKHPDTGHYETKAKYQPKLRPLPVSVPLKPATVIFPRIVNNYPAPQNNYGNVPSVPRVRPVPINSNGYSSGYVSPIILARPASSGRFLNPAPQSPSSSSYYRHHQNHQSNSQLSSLNTVYNNQGHYSQNSNQYAEFPRYASRFPDPALYRNPVHLRARPPPNSVNRPSGFSPIRGFRRPIQSNLVGVSNHNHPTVLKPTQQHEDALMNHDDAHNFFRQGHPLSAIMSPGRNVMNNNMNNNNPILQQQSQSINNPLPSNHLFTINQNPNNNDQHESTPPPLELLKLELPSGDKSKLFEPIPLPLPYPLVHAQFPQSNLNSHEGQKNLPNENNDNRNVVKDVSRQQKSSSSGDNHHYSYPEEQELTKDENENEYNDVLNSQLDQIINLDALKNSIFEQEEHRQHQQHESSSPPDSSSSSSSSSGSSLNPTQIQSPFSSSTFNFGQNNPIIQHLNNIRGMDNTPTDKTRHHTSIPMASEVKLMVMNPLQFQRPQSTRHEKRISKISNGVKSPSPHQPHIGKDVEHLFKNLVPLTEQIRSQKFNQWFGPPSLIQKGQIKSRYNDRVRKKISRIITTTSKTTTTSNPNTDKDGDQNKHQELHHDLDLESKFLNIQLNKTNPLASSSTTFPPFDKALKNIKIRRVAKRIRKKIRRITATTTMKPPT